MRIGLVSTGNGHLGDHTRALKFQENLREMGFSVEVFNPIQQAGPRLSSSQDRQLTQLLSRVWESPMNPLLKMPRMHQIAHEFEIMRLSRTLLNMVKEKRIDLLQAEKHLGAEIALPLKDELGLPLFFDVHSGTLGEDLRTSTNYSKRFIDYMVSKEKRMFSDSDEIIVVSNHMKNHLQSVLGLQNVVVVPNGSDPCPDLEKKHSTPLNVIYAGIFEYWERVDDYLDAIKKLGKYDFRFFLAGNGSLKRRILGRIKAENLPVEYVGVLPRDVLRELMRKMHIGVAPMANQYSRRFCSSVKTFEYMSMGLPVVCADVGEWADAVRANECGIVVPPEDPDAIADGILEYRDECLWRRHSSNGIGLINRRYSWKKLIASLKPLYDKYLS